MLSVLAVVPSGSASWASTLPPVVQTTIDTDEMITVVNEGKAEAEVIATDVGAAEEVAKKKAAISQGIKEECEGDLAKAMPMLHKALKALDTLSKNDIVEVKSMKPDWP